jgi:serine/threonine protein kinase/tetratricopeptide (TPR) repeat protein
MAQGVTAISGASIINGRYRLLDRIGAGGMGEVYRAADLLTVGGEPVAIKRLTTDTANLRFASFDSKTVEDRSAQQVALAHEFRTLAALRHPNIIRVRDYGFDNGAPFLVMDLLDNAQSLHSAGRALNTAGRIDLIVQMLGALAYLHQRGIVHRDLKPENVLVVDGVVKLLDFGLAISRDAMPDADRVAGTLAYMAPEVLSGGEPTPASDLYAVGVMAYELLTGQPPFPFDTVSAFIRQVLLEPPDISRLYALDMPQTDDAPPSSAETDTEPDGAVWITISPIQASAPRPDAPLSLPEVVIRLLEKKPDARFPDARAAIQAFCASIGLPPPQENQAVREGYLQSAEFIGRERELDQLMAAFDQAQSGTGSTWLIGGESGVGKSRLVDELRIRALVNGAVVMRGQAVLGGVPFQLWRDPLRQLIIRGGVEGKISAEQAALFKPLLPDLDALWISATGGDPLPPSPDLDDDERRGRGIRLAMETFAALAGDSGVLLLLILEDIQWAEEGLVSLQVFSTIAQERPLLIVATYRDDEMPDLPEKLPNAQHIRLERFSSRQIERLTDAMLGVGRVPPMLHDLLERETEGNAFFLVEVVRALAEEAGSLSELARRASLPGRVLAGGVQQVIWRRLNRVPEDGRDLLRLAAVAGRAVDPALLTAAAARYGIGTGGLSIEAWLSLCANVAVLEVSEGRWRFAHDKLREALLESLQPDDLARLSRQAAETLEAITPDPGARLKLASVLARHWRAAGDAEREKVYIVEAAKQSFEAQTFIEAAELYARAALLRADDPPPSIATIYLEWARSDFHIGEYERVKTNAAHAQVLFEAENDAFHVAEAMTLVGEAHMRSGEQDQAEALFNETLRLRRVIQNEKYVAFSLTNLGGVAFSRGDNAQARAYWEEALEIMERAGTPHDVSSALTNVAMLYDIEGDSARAEPMFKRAVDIQRALKDRERLSHTLVNYAWLKLGQRNFDEADRLVEEALYLGRLIGDWLLVGFGLQLSGEIATQRGDLKAARGRYEEASALRRRMRHHTLLVDSLDYLAWTCWRLGDQAGARAALRESLPIRLSRGYFHQPDRAFLTGAHLRIIDGDDLGAYRLVAHTRASAKGDFMDTVFDHALDAALRQRLSPDIIAAIDADPGSAESLAASILDQLGA